MNTWLPLAAREPGELGNVIVVVGLDKYSPLLGVQPPAALNKTGVLLARRKGVLRSR